MKKQILGYENYYIYDNGDVYNSSTGKMLEGSIGEHGYRYYRLSKNGKKKMFYGHRLVAEAFIPNPDNLPVVNHIDGNKINNEVSNLEWVSYSNNTLKWHRDTQVKKERTQFEKYTTDLEGEIWEDHPDGFPYKVSNLGRVRNIKTNNILHPSLACGYYKIRCSKDGLTKDYILHKLVYITFSQNRQIADDEVIDHINGNKLDNRFNNLRKIKLSENVKAALYEQKTNKSCKIVYQYDTKGNFIQSFPSTAEAGRQLHLDSSSISKVCRGKVKTCGGFVFSYEQKE